MRVVVPSWNRLVLGKGRGGAMGPVMRYSEAFKLQVVRELEEGKYRTAGEAGRVYGVKGEGTVGYWVRKYGKNQLLRKVVRVETPKERDELKELRQRVRALERELADAHLDRRLEQAYVKLACRAAGIEDVEGFKKKHGGELSTR